MCTNSLSDLTWQQSDGIDAENAELVFRAENE